MLPVDQRQLKVIGVDIYAGEGIYRVGSHPQE
jgi:hypothetical protein